MSKIKKCLAVLVCMAMVLVPGAAFAGEMKWKTDAYTEDGLGYCRLKNGGICITDYNGDNGKVFVPAEIEGLPVTAIGDCAFEHDYITSITLPASVTELNEWPFEDCWNLEEIIIEPDNKNDNKNIVSMDGVLFEELDDRWLLFQYPQGNTRTSYVVPYGVKSIHEMRSLKLTSVTIPNSIESFGIVYCPNLTDVYYTGSEEEWANITCYFGDIIDPSYMTTTIHYNSPMPETTPLVSDSVPEINVTVNGSKIDFDVPPKAIDGTTMLPVRLALEPLGAEFVWDGENNTVTITAKGKTIVLTIGSATALVDGIEKLMAQPAMATDGRTLIPIRFVSEELGYNVDWDGETSTVIIEG